MKRLFKSVLLAFLKCERWFLKYITAKRILYMALGCILLFPYLFTRSWGWFHFNANTGVIGDTIGGITAPVSGFLGAALVYLALKEQIKANKIITDQFKEQKKDEHSKKIISIVTDQLKMLREDLKDFEHKKYSKSGVKVGLTTSLPSPVITNSTAAIAKYLSDYPTIHFDYREDQSDMVKSHLEGLIREIGYFLRTTRYLITLASDPAVEEYDRGNLLMLIYEVYTVKIHPPLKQFENRREANQPECPKCKARHGIPESLYSIYDDINHELNGGVFIRL